LAAKKVALAAAFDRQNDYHAYDADVFVGYPSGPGAITAQAAFNRIDGGRTFTTLPKQSVAFLEAGYFLRHLKLTPVLHFTRRDVVDTDNGDETRWSIGANY
jgi:hypothetical protein